MTFQPYQEAGEEMKKQSQLPLKLAKQGASLATFALGGGTAVTRILPLLNKLIPIAMARKGLEKIDPRYGKFFNSANKLGHTDEEAREYLSEKMTPAIEEEERRPKNAQEAMAMNISKAQKRRQPSDFSRESLQEQFEQGQQNQGKTALLQTMQEITNLLRGMRGQGG